MDICYSATQKCVGAPPGLAPITLGPRAIDAMRNRETPVQSFYLGMADLETYWSNTRAYHHTTPISMMYALREALAMMVEEGLENRIERHARCATALRSGLQAMGIGLFADPNHHLNPLTTAVIPDGVEDANVRTRLLEDYNIEISGGLGDTRGRIWRIGLMGDSCREVNVLALLSALERILPGRRLPRRTRHRRIRRPALAGVRGLAISAEETTPSPTPAPSARYAISSTSTTCITAISTPRNLTPVSNCIMQPGFAVATTSAPVAITLSILFRNRRDERSACSIEYVPAPPQQRLDSSISTSSNPGMLPRISRGGWLIRCACTKWHGSW